MDTLTSVLGVANALLRRLGKPNYGVALAPTRPATHSDAVFGSRRRGAQAFRAEPSLDVAPEFTVRLAKSGAVVGVPNGVSILEALERAGYAPSYMCRSGTCGTCVTAVLDGCVEHRDTYLDADEREQCIAICVSRAASGEELTLDL